MGYATISCGAPSLLARLVLSSSKWAYIDNYSPLFNVCLWEERNSRCYENNERSIPDLKLFFFKTLLVWLSALQNQSFSSLLAKINYLLLLLYYCTDIQVYGYIERESVGLKMVV